MASKCKSITRKFLCYIIRNREPRAAADRRLFFFLMENNSIEVDDTDRYFFFYRPSHPANEDYVSGKPIRLIKYYRIENFHLDLTGSGNLSRPERHYDEIFPRRQSPRAIIGPVGLCGKSIALTAPPIKLG